MDKLVIPVSNKPVTLTGNEPKILTGIPKVPSQKISEYLAQAAFFEKMANQKKTTLLKNLTPEGLGQLITQVKANNTDANTRELSNEETQEFVGRKIADFRKVVAENEKLPPELKDKNLRPALQKDAEPCAYLSSPLYSGHAENKLNHMSSSMSFNVEILQTLAKTINKCGEEYDKDIEDVRVRLANKWKEPFLINGNQPSFKFNAESREIINRKFDDTSHDAISRIKEVFHTHPEFVAALMKLPKVSEQTMTPADFCSNLPNNQTAKGQAKIALK